MCGIVGYWNTNGMMASPDLIKRMVQRIEHRGPDGVGYYTKGAIGLGHARLAIIDTSDAGAQPMCNDDKSIWITFNGEIYNYKSLRDQLNKKGVRFKSQTDTEVIIRAYEFWGIDCLKYFCGMFSFAIWDQSLQRLWIVRDRIGIKPLFYILQQNRIAFSSEIKALLLDPATPFEMDYRALSYYLSLNYTPAPHTLFSNVKQLLPAHYLLVEKDREPVIKQYWELEFNPEQSPVQSEKAWVEEFSELFKQVVSDHLVCDVPYGAFLSGGLDSSAIVYLMNNILQSPVKAFTIGFPQKSFDESEYAACVARHLNVDHYTEKIPVSSLDTIIQKINYHAEEPTADSSMVGVYFLAQLARQHVSMVLSGDGADEILAGYETYQAFYLLKLFQIIPGVLRKGFNEGLSRILPVTEDKIDCFFKARRFLMNSNLSPEDAHANWRTIFSRQQREQLLSPISNNIEASSDVNELYRDCFKGCSAQNSLNRLLYVDTKLYLPNDMLVKVDRMTMAHGLEARVPYLDHRLVEFMATVPPKLKLKWLIKKKYLLKKAMEKHLPRNVVFRSKAGFNVPKNIWLKKELKSYVTDILSPSQLGQMGFLDCKFTQQLLTDHFTGKADNSFQIWGLLNLALWWKQFMGSGATK